MSFCNDKRYKDCLAPAVKAFWSEVAEPFGSRALHNLDLSHVLGKAMCPNWGAKIPDYGVWDHIAQICAPFFQGIESHAPNMRSGGIDGRRSVQMHRCLRGSLQSLPWS